MTELQLILVHMLMEEPNARTREEAELEAMVIPMDLLRENMATNSKAEQFVEKLKGKELVK